MNSSDYKVPSFLSRIYSVWFRHIRVYMSNFWSNAFPPFFEPLIFLAGLGLGLSRYIPDMGGMPYILFLGTGLVVTSSMYTSAFECTYGTFIRLEFDKVYDGMLGAPISTSDVVVGEILFAGTKGFFFSFAVLIVLGVFRIIDYPLSILAPVIGFITGIMFATLGMYITSFVRNINHFNFFLTGVLSPLFFFSGVVFPINELPDVMQIFAEILPLTHVVRLARAFCLPGLMEFSLLYDVAYVAVFITAVGFLALRGIRKRMIL